MLTRLARRSGIAGSCAALLAWTAGCEVTVEPTLEQRVEDAPPVDAARDTDLATTAPAPDVTSSPAGDATNRPLVPVPPVAGSWRMRMRFDLYTRPTAVAKWRQHGQGPFWNFEIGVGGGERDGVVEVLGRGGPGVFEGR